MARPEADHPVTMMPTFLLMMSPAQNHQGMSSPKVKQTTNHQQLRKVEIGMTVEGDGRLHLTGESFHRMNYINMET